MSHMGLINKVDTDCIILNRKGLLPYLMLSLKTYQQVFQGQILLDQLQKTCSCYKVQLALWSVSNPSSNSKSMILNWTHKHQSSLFLNNKMDKSSPFRKVRLISISPLSLMMTEILHKMEKLSWTLKIQKVNSFIKEKPNKLSVQHQVYQIIRISKLLMRLKMLLIMKMYKIIMVKLKISKNFNKTMLLIQTSIIKYLVFHNKKWLILNLSQKMFTWQKKI